jgi:hypothetical protein
MQIPVSTHQLGRRYRDIAARVDQIADQAAALIVREMRGQMPYTEIVVTEERHVIPLVQAANQQAISTSQLPIRRMRAELANTTLSGSGVLIVINASARPHRDQAGLDTTVVHELAHAVQFGRTGVRDDVVRSLRNNYGLEPLTWLQARKANKQVAADEREAESMERLATQLT